MNEQTIYNGLLIASFVIAAIVFVSLFFISAPYGRHARQGWGYTLGNKLGWVLMEAASPIVFLVCFLFGESGKSPVSLVFLALWELHNLHRAFIYPFSLRGSVRRMPIGVIAMGIFFNFLNGYLNGRYIFGFSGGYPNSWLTDPRFIIGVLLFLAGYIINRQADLALRGLRKTGESGYKISDHRLYRWVSSPNYLGEITIWAGWALATWSLAGLSFAVWTVANLLPRARTNHAWYRKTFPDYPPERKALIPYVW
jgi:protein-S-isoprenylcysteine O-methyltransferase Ste14